MGHKIIFSHGSAHSSGVMILFNKVTNFEPTNTSICAKGRYIFLEGIKDTANITSVNIYAPNYEREQCEFYESININFLNSVSTENIIMGGDFNTVLDISKDKKGGNTRKK